MIKKLFSFILLLNIINLTPQDMQPTLLQPIKKNLQSEDEKNLSELFKEMYKLDYISKAFEPFFTSLNISDPKVKKKSLEVFMEKFEKDFIKIYKETFTLNEIKQLLKFFNSKIGTKFTQQRYPIEAKLTESYMSFPKIVFQINDEINPPKESGFVINFANLTKDQKNIEEIFNKEVAQGITVVKFFAIWCSPCKIYAPKFEQVAEKNQEITKDDKKIKIKYITIDADKFPEILKLANVTAFPTTVLYQDGKQIESIIGVQTEEDLAKKIKDLASK